MKPRQFRALVIGCAFIVASAPMLFATNNKEQQEAEALFTKARDLSNLWAKGSPPFELDAEVTFYNLQGAHEEGDYRLIWKSKGESLRAISFPDYHSISVQHAGKTWGSSTLLYTPYLVWRLENAFSYPSGLEAPVKQKLTKVRKRSIDGISAECTGYLEKQHNQPKERHTYCFDSASGHLISAENRHWFTSLELSDYVPAGAKAFPRTLRVLQNGQLIVEAKVSSLTANLTTAEEVFAPPPGIQPVPQIRCGKGLGVAAHRVSAVMPGYPLYAKQQRIQGTVNLYADIGKDGIPRGLTVLHSPADVLSQASLAAVGQWRYAPATCSGVAVDVITVIDVNFRLSQ